VNAIVVFCVNFIAIIPLAALLSYSTEELALYVGEVLGGLLNASFGNAVELIVSIIALAQRKTLIVQTSLVGSMLSNLLLVLGMCFFFGGLNRTEQNFNVFVSGTACSLLALAIGVFIIPAAFAQFTPGDGDDGVTPLSRGVAVLLLLVYACYLFFQLRTHSDVYNEKSEKTPTKKEKAQAQQNGKVDSVSQGIATIGAGTAAASGGSINGNNLVSDKKNDTASTENNDDEDEELPQLTRVGALITLAVSTVFIALCAESMVSAIDVLAEDISEEFIGLILLPIVGNAAEHATAVTVAIKDKMDLAIGVAVGSSLQIALLIFPFMVLINWFGLGSPADLNLNMDGFQVAVLFISIILVNYVIQDGKSHWLEGVMLMMLYCSIAVAAFVYVAPGEVAG
jgi:Ca2+:H+ antiporter